MKKKMSILLIVSVALLLVLLAIFWLQPTGRSAPPPGPHKAGDVWLANLGGKSTMAMVWCPPGKFMMGSLISNRGPFGLVETKHEVTLTQGFWMGKYEMTQRQWQAVMRNNPSHFKGKDLPVEQVSWDDAQSFCRKLTEQQKYRLPVGYEYRLPTEAEWEYACRAKCARAYAGNGVLDEMGWYNRNSDKTHCVGSKRPNAWGLYDMHGNVWEWCQDWCGDYPTGAVTDPVGPATGVCRMSRGGSWNGNARNCGADCRHKVEPGYRSIGLGFRVAYGIKPEPLASEKKQP